MAKLPIHIKEYQQLLIMIELKCRSYPQIHLRSNHVADIHQSEFLN